ncbi:elongation factor P hydroxylase [Exilibacterium tricleocarpae]|uniref:Elongation factor P hydroxylase n=1 Tax=Exilibacterium tricleocarpae TaxID=2591008 RepID=A0A545SS51_9GAMM|nr:elongation factor P hydroxylase [Exilibacterium tricleocarpae]TQV67782.1 elongation factor P hydroxylase [Exilibacterium tricleocarpae]
MPGTAPAGEPTRRHWHCDHLIDVFERNFLASHNTRLVKNGVEPVYLPARRPGERHRIVFTRDYFASALHEVAHWCIAGPQRRLLQDYGYWYQPDGRSAEQQRRFEQVEVKPQALEWVFATAAGYRFRVSADNLNGGAAPSADFLGAIYRQVLAYCEGGLPARAAAFTGALAAFYQRHQPFDPLHAGHYKCEGLT